jgi:hypothetical protein
MWRLEAIRAKGGDRSIEVVSGFRSVPYNSCVSDATLSQHQYGTAANIRIAGIGGHRERRIARHSQIHGIECYSSASTTMSICGSRTDIFPKRSSGGGRGAIAMVATSTREGGPAGVKEGAAPDALALPFSCRGFHCD